MTTNHFRLPTAWRSASSGPRTANVRFGDLAVALGNVAEGDDGLSAVLAAAHLTVLGMLTEEHAFRTDIVWAPHKETVHTLGVQPGATHTWRESVGLVRCAVRAMTPSAENGEASHADRALFTTDASAEGCHGAGRYGLRVGVRDGTLVLHTSSISDGYLTSLASMYRRVLEAMAAGGDTDAACLPDEERHAVLVRWAAGPSVSRAPDTVVDLFQAQAARTPQAPAVTADATSLTYRDLDLRANQLAHRLVDLGVRPETPVGVCLRRTAGLLPAILGVWKAGGAYLPLDADLPAQRLRHMVRTAGCDLVITETAHLPAVSGLDGVAFVLLDREREAIRALPSTPVGARTSPAQLAYVIYTSGSTGNPKGVLVQHGSLTNYLLWTAERYAARGTGGSPLFTSISFDLGIPSLLTPLLVGQPVTLLPDPMDTADLGPLLAAGAPYSFVKLTPGHLNLLSLDLSPEQAHGLAGLVIAAGDAFPAAVARRWVDLAGPGGTAVATEYGPTEITIGNSAQAVTNPHSEGLIPLGAPIPNTTMYVLTDRLEPVPVGVPGEVYVGGAGVARGYLADPALTADRFVPDPHGPAGARLYRTGDRARWQPSGSLEFLGRTDHQVKIRGYRVEPAEVRTSLRRRPDVGEAVVIAHEQPPRPTRLVAFVIPAAGRALDAPRLRADLATELPDHMVPSEIVALSDLPLTANGKVDTRALRELL